MISFHIVEDEHRKIGHFKSEMNDENEGKWITSCTVSSYEESMYMLFTMDYHSEKTSFFNINIKKPYIFKSLIKNIKCGTDGCFDISGKPIFINNDAEGIALVSSIINKDTPCKLPIIYISKKESGEYYIDPEIVANMLYGMAHTLVETEPNFVNICCPSQFAPYNGAVACFDKNHALPWIFLPKDGEQEKIAIPRIFNKIRMLLLSKTIPYFNSESYYTDICNKNVMHSIQKKSNEYFSELFNQMSSIIDQKNNEIANKEKEIHEFHARNFQNNGDINDELLISKGKEQDIYSGEVADVVLEVIKNAVGSERHTRRACILNDILAHNPIDGTREIKRGRLREILKGIRNIDQAESDFRELGFEIIRGGKHPVIKFKNDTRFVHGAPSSGSDGSRGMKNLASDMIKMFL